MTGQGFPMMRRSKKRQLIEFTCDLKSQQTCQYVLMDSSENIHHVISGTPLTVASSYFDLFVFT